jgi:biopolymer transport protein TolQ
MTPDAMAIGARVAPVHLDPLSLVLHASGPIFLVVWSLVAASAGVWIIAVLKVLQVRRLVRAERRFEEEAARATDGGTLLHLSRRHPDAPGARVVLGLVGRSGAPAAAHASAARRALVGEHQRAEVLMPTLSSIAAAAPFVGLFGTVYGIMDAFLRIGQERSASLPVVAPAIGEALITTAIGLFAAIPAVVAYNVITKRIDDLLAAVEASSEGWVALFRSGPHPAE